MSDTTFVPDVIRESAPMHATRLDLVSANRRGQNLALASARPLGSAPISTDTKGTSK